MKTAMAAMTFAIGMLALTSTEASAWFCSADSSSAYGWGRSYSQGEARRRALWECARRTPRYQTCYISYCN